MNIAALSDGDLTYLRRLLSAEPGTELDAETEAMAADMVAAIDEEIAERSSGEQGS
jgi:hypothetical protein